MAGLRSIYSFYNKPEFEPQADGMGPVGTQRDVYDAELGLNQEMRNRYANYLKANGQQPQQQYGQTRSPAEIALIRQRETQRDNTSGADAWAQFANQQSQPSYEERMRAAQIADQQRWNNDPERLRMQRELEIQAANELKRNTQKGWLQGIFGN